MLFVNTVLVENVGEAMQGGPIPGLNSDSTMNASIALLAS